MPTHDLASRLIARTTYAVNPYPSTEVPSARALHLMNRMGTGWSRGTWRQLRAAGGADAWFAQQLAPRSIRESAIVRSLGTWYPALAESPATKWQRHQSGQRGSFDYARDLGNQTMVRRVHTTRPVLETMVDFWANHLHVPANHDKAWVQRWSYEQLLRRHALGRFEDLLVAASLHPAMLLYLDNWRSVRGAPNENQGRELLELHTVDRDAGYSEDMVKASARILSGWTVDVGGTWEARYDATKHTTGPVQVLDFSDANAAPDGSDLTVRYLRYLAHHPWTARTLARRLAVKFVSDDPSDSLVGALADVYLASGTDITAVLKALVARPEFRGSAGRKVRTPVEDFVATCRALQVVTRQPRQQWSFGNVVLYLPQSTRLYMWPRPDGAPETSADWASAGRMLSSFRMHWSLAGPYYPTLDVSYRTPASWLPQRSIRLDRFVDHLSRMLLGRVSTTTDLRAVCQATGFGPGEIVTATHPLIRWMFARLVVVLLDSPAHLTR